MRPIYFTLLVLFNYTLIIDLSAQYGRDALELNSYIAASNLNLQQKDSTTFDYNLLNKYIELALENNPRIKIAELETKVTKQEVRLARYSWTKEVSGQFNLNQINAAEWGLGSSKTATSNAFFPLYGFTLRFTAGTFILTPMEVKKANQQHNIALKEKESESSKLINDVIKAYQNYVLRQKSLLLKLEIENKFYSLYSLVSKIQNSKDLGSMEKEAQIFNSYNQSLEARNNAEAELRLAKYELESLIGVKLETVSK